MRAPAVRLPVQVPVLEARESLRFFFDLLIARADRPTVSHARVPTRADRVLTESVLRHRSAAPAQSHSPRSRQNDYRHCKSCASAFRAWSQRWPPFRRGARHCACPALCPLASPFRRHHEITLRRAGLARLRRRRAGRSRLRAATRLLRSRGRLGLAAGCCSLPRGAWPGWQSSPRIASSTSLTLTAATLFIGRFRAACRGATLPTSYSLVPSWRIFRKVHSSHEAS